MFRKVPLEPCQNDALGTLEPLEPLEPRVAPYTSLVPVGSAFHARTFDLCESLNYRDWAGYYAVSAYETHHEHEYNAIRNACALIDISPLYKYLVTGPDALRLVNRVITRDASKMSVGQVYYTPWCSTLR